ncbi:MAG: hypothetical protein IJH39_02040 [Clostridia bacterium]|nr:hypothetical protein [Clostridia bacterium]
MHRVIKNKIVNQELLDEEIQKNIYKAEDDYINGRVIDAEDLFREWDTKYGVQN